MNSSITCLFHPTYNHATFFLLIYFKDKTFTDFSNKHHAFDDMRKPIQEDFLDIHRNRTKRMCHLTLTCYLSHRDEGRSNMFLCEDYTSIYWQFCAVLNATVRRFVQIIWILWLTKWLIMLQIFPYNLTWNR